VLKWEYTPIIEQPDEPMARHLPDYLTSSIRFPEGSTSTFYNKLTRAMYDLPERQDKANAGGQQGGEDDGATEYETEYEGQPEFETDYGGSQYGGDDDEQNGR
jgi:hypothetical protein